MQAKKCIQNQITQWKYKNTNSSALPLPMEDKSIHTQTQ
jgi:hypothetical protein